jgi:AraC family transcriptional regulator
LIGSAPYVKPHTKPIPARQDLRDRPWDPPDGCGFILHEKGLRHHWEGVGLLSVKTFSQGRALYDSGPGLCAVDDSSYLILNDGQPYSITIESERPVESFCIFFKPGFAEKVYYSLSSSQGALLDNPEPPGRPRIGFFDRVYPHDDILSPVLLSLKSSSAEKRARGGWLEEQFYELMGLLLRVRLGAMNEALTLTAVRLSTREELYRRLCRARDYMSACLDRRLTLEEISGVACLSPNHLLRSFRQAFGLTPHQYLTARRMEQARKMLADQNMSVTEVCLSVGFESLGSFSRTFRRHTGLSPSECRRKR